MRIPSKPSVFDSLLSLPLDRAVINIIFQSFKNSCFPFHVHPCGNSCTSCDSMTFTHAISFAFCRVTSQLRGLTVSGDLLVKKRWLHHPCRILTWPYKPANDINAQAGLMKNLQDAFVIFSFLLDPVDRLDFSALRYHMITRGMWIVLLFAF